jgi:hypothetical protein
MTFEHIAAVLGLLVLYSIYRLTAPRKRRPGGYEWRG